MPLVKQWVFGPNPLRYSSYQFALFRIVFGAYLTWHFAHLIPFAPELFSCQGMLPNTSLLPTAKFFPNLLVWFPSPAFASGFVSVLLVLAVLLVFGIARPVVAVLLWFGWATLFNRNIFISNPGIPMVGWVFLALALVPQGEPLRLGKKSEDWQIPPILFWGAWLIVGVGYTVSGLHKMGSPSWANGSAIRLLLDNPLARETAFRHFLLDMPPWIFNVKTYFSLGLEVLFLPLILLRWTRPIAWFGIVGMHFGILTMVSFADLTLGVLMMHFFTFDARWLMPAKSQGAPVLFFDGACGLCNSTVDFIMKEDAVGHFKFSPLQGEYAKKELDTTLVQNLNTLALKVDGKLLTRSDAVLKISQLLGGIWRLAAIGYLVPRPLRDRLYDFVAAHRYQWFGRKEACRVPTPTERERFFS